MSLLYAKASEPFEAYCEGLAPRSYAYGGRACRSARRTVRRLSSFLIKFDGGLLLLFYMVVQSRGVRLYYSTITVGFQLVFLFLYVIL